MQPSPGSGVPATYGGGGATLLRTGGWCLLLDVRPDDPLVGRCWDRLGTTPDPDDVLETVVAPDGHTTPAFVLVRESGVRRVVAKGARTLRLDGRDLLAGGPAGATVDLALDDVAVLEAALEVGPPAEVVAEVDAVVGAGSLPLRDGVVRASSVHLVLAPEEHRPGPPVDVHGRRPRSDDTQPFVETTGSDEAGTLTVRARRPTATDPVEVEAPRVLAAVCPAGHLTPAYSGVCRVCRRAVAVQEPFETARPALGRLLVPQGEAVLLDRGAVLGRAPHVPRDWSGPAPRLVALPDPDRDVSAQHVSVVLDLWNVLVCDLGSTNGTALVDEAGRTTRLRPYEPVALRAGGAVVLADVLTLAFEAQP